MQASLAQQAHWLAHNIEWHLCGNHLFVNAKALQLREMTPAEIEAEGWEVGYGNGTPIVMVLSNGVKLYPSQDYEGNGGGVWFGIDTEGESIAL